MKRKNKILMMGFVILFFIPALSFCFIQGINAQEKKESRKILYYRNPMDPSVTSPTPMKDPMGMGYIPVYEEQDNPEAVSGQEPIVRINAGQQQLIGVRTEPAAIRPLVRIIRAAAKIAYDPELYRTEEEFIQALKMKESMKLSRSLEVSERMDALVEASILKLKLQGLSDAQIEELKTKAGPDRSLLISDSVSPYAWAYAAVYEYDIDLIKAGQEVSLKVIAYPQEEFHGKIAAVDPVLDAVTRSVRARLQIDNPQAKLKPNMYADAFIRVDLGRQLSIPKEAVLDTGIRKIVYLDLGNGNFRAQGIELGPEAIVFADGKEDGYFPVIKGLKEDDVVVTNGNFLIDSQSQLSGGVSALWSGATEIKQEGESETKTQHKH